MRVRPGPTTEGNDRLDLLAQPLLEGRASLVDAHFAELVAAGAVGKEPPGFVDDRHALRFEPVDRRRDQVANGAHLLRLERPVHLEHDRRRRLHLVARKQRPLRQHQMHARGNHSVEPPGGARKLPLECA
jgi:hypothetical protein